MKLRLYARLMYSTAFGRQRQEDGKLASLTREILTQENKQTNRHTKNERKKSRNKKFRGKFAPENKLCYALKSKLSADLESRIYEG